MDSLIARCAYAQYHALSQPHTRDLLIPTRGFTDHRLISPPYQTGFYGVTDKRAEMMCVSSITEAELLHGAEKSQQREHNLRQVADFLSRLDVLPYTSKAASHYGDIRADLERNGRLIGINDLHIAAHTRSEGLVLVSNNLREFERVAGLRLENWIAAAQCHT